MNCNCSKYPGSIKTKEAMETRALVSNEIKATLELMVVGNWRSIYRCKSCGITWCEDFIPARHIDIPVYFQIKTDSPEEWLKTTPALLEEIVAGIKPVDEAFEYEEDVGPERCRKCHRLRTKFSPFCTRHHLESLSNK